MSSLEDKFLIVDALQSFGFQEIEKQRGSSCFDEKSDLLMAFVSHLRAVIAEIEVRNLTSTSSEDLSGGSCVQMGVMPICRVLAADDREMYEMRCDSGSTVPRWSLPVAVSQWNEQTALKIARRFQTYRVLVRTENLLADAGLFTEEVAGTLVEHAKTLVPSGTYDTHEPAAPPLQPVTSPTDTSSICSWKSSGSSPVMGLVRASKYVSVKETTGVASGEGKLVLTQPVAAFHPFMGVDFEEMFYIDTVVAHCALGAELFRNWKQNVPDAETVLVLCLIYEYFIVGVERSRWKKLLRRLPKQFPTFPINWSIQELQELEGTGVLELVNEKRHRGIDFVKKSRQLMSLVLVGIPDLPQPYSIAITAFVQPHINWARSVFDSRALHLNFGGIINITLAPDVDMINHSDRTHILTRRIDMDHRRLILETGAPLPQSLVGQELLFSYGPLQSFELLLSYGFVTTEDNTYDRLPFPINFDLSEECYFGGVDYRAKRVELIKKFHLVVPDSGELWIPYNGVPPPTLLALLRLLLGEPKDFSELERDVFGGSSSPAALELKVIDTVEMVVKTVLREFPSTLAEAQSRLLVLLCQQNEELTSRNDSVASLNQTITSIESSSPERGVNGTPGGRSVTTPSNFQIATPSEASTSTTTTATTYLSPPIGPLPVTEPPSPGPPGLQASLAEGDSVVHCELQNRTNALRLRVKLLEIAERSLTWCTARRQQYSSS